MMNCSESDNSLLMSHVVVHVLVLVDLVDFFHFFVFLYVEDKISVVRA